MNSVVVRFPDGSREFRYPERELEAGDAIWHDGQRYAVVHVGTDEHGRPVVTVELDSEALGDILRSERGAIELVPVDS